MYVSNTLLLIEKESYKKVNKFKVLTMHLVDKNYEIASVQTMKKPPELGIWLQYSRGTTKGETPISPRIYRRFEGQIVLKAHDFSTVGEILGSVQRTLPKIQAAQSEARTSAVESPTVATKAEAWSYDCNRAIAKIGFNLLAHYIGANNARHPAFDKIKRAILMESPFLPATLISNNEVSSMIFGVPPEHHHCLYLTALPVSASKIKIMFMALIYGYVRVWVTLAEKAPKFLMRDSVYFLVDHKNNKISEVNSLDYLRQFNPDLVKKFSYPFNPGDMKINYPS